MTGGGAVPAPPPPPHDASRTESGTRTMRRSRVTRPLISGANGTRRMVLIPKALNADRRPQEPSWLSLEASCAYQPWGAEVSRDLQDALGRGAACLSNVRFW